MRNSIFLALALLFTIMAQGAPVIRAVTNNGSWSTGSTWNLNRKPQSGDTIIIPAGKTVVLNSQETLSNVYIEVSGTLKYANILTFLSLNGTSSIVVNTGGTIQATINYLQFIFIVGSTIFNNGTISGPMLANTASGGFVSFNPLPVKFLGFTLTRKGNDVWIQWSTSMEMNVGRFELERSTDGRNWEMIGTVLPSNDNAAIHNYAFTDRDPALPTIYYRVKEIDIDGRSVYTSIQVVKMDQHDQHIRISGIDKKVLLQFPAEIKGKVMVRFFNYNGQILDQQTIVDPFGQVILYPRASGSLIISVTDDKAVNASAKVVL